MTDSDKQLLMQLLRRNHQLTFKTAALETKLDILEKTRPPVEVLNTTIAAFESKIDEVFRKLQMLSLIVDWTVDELDGDFSSFVDQAENIVDKERLQCQFEQPTTDKEDGQ